MNEEIKNQLKYLKLYDLLENWDIILKEANNKKKSYTNFLTQIIDKEFFNQKNRARDARIKRSKIPEMLVMETFPFNKQQNLNKKIVLEIYDSLNYVTDKLDLVFIGPTGCGKTGLATSYLIHAINEGYRGLFIDFKDLIEKLYQAKAAYKEKKLISYYNSFDVLLIDECGYDDLDKMQSGLFFEVLKKRLRKKTTILTSQLGFEEWNSFINNEHITAAILNRLTVNCAVFNMKDCISIRPKNIISTSNV